MDKNNKNSKCLIIFSARRALDPAHEYVQHHFNPPDIDLLFTSENFDHDINWDNLEKDLEFPGRNFNWSEATTNKKDELTRLEYHTILILQNRFNPKRYHNVHEVALKIPANRRIIIDSEGRTKEINKIVYLIYKFKEIIRVTGSWLLDFLFLLPNTLRWITKKLFRI